MSSSDDNEDNLKAAEEVGCYGLVGGVAKNIRTHKTHYAENSSRSDGPFYCGSCYSDAVLRKCAEKKDHFAHKTPLSPVLPKGESELHEQCKKSICEYLSGIFPEGKWATERPIDENKKKKLTALRDKVNIKVPFIITAFCTNGVISYEAIHLGAQWYFNGDGELDWASD